MVSLEMPQQKWASCRLEWRGSWIFPSFSRCSPCVDSGPEAEDSSPVLTWILGYFWSLHKGVRPSLEWGHERAISSHAVAAVSRFPLRGPRDLWLSLESFPRCFPTGLSHVSRWCESILGVKAEAVQGKQVPVERTDTSGGVLEWWHDPAVPLPFPLESATLRCDGNAGNSFPNKQGKDPSSRGTSRKRSSSGCGRDHRATS